MNEKTNNLYIHQIEIENKQLREQLQLCRSAINEIKKELNNKTDNQDKIINEQALEIAKLKLKIKKAKIKIDVMVGNGNEQTIIDDLLQLDEILGEKENE